MQGRLLAMLASTMVLLPALVSCQPVTAEQRPSVSTVYVYGTAPAGTLVTIYYPTGSETDARADDNGVWGQTVNRQSGVFELVADGGCVTVASEGGSVRNCRATFRLPEGDECGGFVVEEKR